ncbi:MAG TPA: hypothetical protein VEV13_05920 [Candidatus Limnocylindria bacterium]|nr:hypothetical protein [Candidatus Limnocylindria bacterium]
MTDAADASELDGPLLDPADDAAITALLASLPEVAMPEDVAARIATTLAAEVPLSGPVPAWAAGGTTNVTVLPSQREREQRRSNRNARILSGAAALVLVLGAVAVGTQVFQGTDDSSTAGSPTPAEAGADSFKAPSATLLTSSGTAYTEAALDTQVTGLVTAASAPNAPLTELPEGVAAPPSPSASASSGGVRVFDASALIGSTPELATCLAKLTDGSPEVPIAVDAGTWQTAPAVVVVLQGEQAGRVDVFVVAPTCADATDPDAHVLYFAAVKRR